MRFLFIINPSSGRSGNEDALALIRDTMENHLIEYKVFHTTGQNDDQQIAHELNAFKPTTIVACGGDGTIQLVARNIIHKQITLGIVPLGSANGLATAMNIPAKTAEALAILVAGNRKVPFDLLQINDHICVHLSDVGTNALLVKNYEESGDKGLLGYARHLMPSIRKSELMQYTITTPEETVEKQGYMLMIANANQYGTGVKISDGSVSDGAFEIRNVGELDLQSAVKAGLTALNIFVDKNMFAEVITTREATVKIDRKAHVQVDGEYLGEFDTLHARIIPSAIHILVPS